MAVTLLLGVAAVNTGNNLLFLVVSAMLGFMAVTGLVGWLNIRNLELDVKLPDEVYAGVETLVSVEVRNRRRFLSSFLIKVSLWGKETLCTVVERGAVQRGTVLHAFRGRGVHTLEHAVVASSFPVNFFVRRRDTALSRRTFTVFPAPIPTTGVASGGKPENAGAFDSRARGYEGELSRIVDYQGGESLKLIHWRLSAKHEQLKVKELTALVEEPVVLEPELLPGTTLEERIGRATFLINRLLKGGRPVGLKLGDRVIEPDVSRSHKLHLLGELAVYGKS